MVYQWNDLKIFETNDPIEIGQLMVDLFDGGKDRVQYVTTEPKPELKTWPEGRCTEAELAELREAEGYIPTQRFERIVWKKAPDELGASGSGTDKS